MKALKPSFLNLDFSSFMKSVKLQFYNVFFFFFCQGLACVVLGACIPNRRSEHRTNEATQPLNTTEQCISPRPVGHYLIIPALKKRALMVLLVATLVAVMLKNKPYFKSAHF